MLMIYLPYECITLQTEFGFSKVMENYVQDNWHKKSTNSSVWYEWG